MKLFLNDLMVPEVCPPEMLLPNDENYLRHQTPSENGIVSAIEVAYLLLGSDLPSLPGMHLVKKYISIKFDSGQISDVHQEIRRCDFLNHCGRVLAKVALDPRRYEKFDLVAVYNADRYKSLSSHSEIMYFEHFADNFGVVDRNG